jgi:pilus assembly protein CpaC
MDKKWLLLLMIVLLLSVSVVSAADPENVESILLTVGDCKILRVDDFVRVASSNSEAVEIVVTSGRELLINAKKPGLTVVNIWTKQSLFTYRVAVQEDFSNIEREISRLINIPGVTVSVNAKYVILSGTVETSLDSDLAGQYAKMYRDFVINNLFVKNKYQVLLTIMVTEMKKESEKKYGFRWGSFFQTTQGVVFNEWTGALAEQGKNSFGRYPDNWVLGAMLDAMQKNGDAKILAAPSILSVSGKEASFLAGGEIPIPMKDSQGGLKVEWKEYGIKLKVTATIGKDNMIAMNVSPEVSALDWTNAVIAGGDRIPALSTRKATTNVEFADGATFVIGGLLKREDAKTNVKVPFLGDLPIIGKLFQSKDFQKGDTELLFFVTPRIIKDETKVDPKMVTGPDQGPYFENDSQVTKDTKKNKDTKDSKESK